MEMKNDLFWVGSQAQNTGLETFISIVLLKRLFSSLKDGSYNVIRCNQLHSNSLTG